MPEKKRHHFVPRFYLKNFSIDNKIDLLILKSYRFIRRVNYTEHCRIDDFYGAGSVTEDLLGNIENIVAPRIKSIITKEIISDDIDFILLQWFILLQDARTKRNSDILWQMTESLFQAMGTNVGIKDELQLTSNSPAIPAIKAISKNLLSIIDLDYIIIKNNSAMKFITSDNPVVRYNQYLRHDEVINHIGLDSKGLLILFPLSPDILLILFDSETYKLNAGDVVEVSNEDIKRINELQLLNADEIVFISELRKNNEKNFVDWTKNIRQANPTIIKEPQIFPSGSNKILIINQYPKLNYYKELSFIEYLNGEAILDKKTRKYQQREYWKQRQ